MRFWYVVGLVLLLSACQQVPQRPAPSPAPPKITPSPTPMVGVLRFAGGDGSSYDQAVVILGANEATGVRSEYRWIAQRYPGYKRGSQALMHRGRQMYDVLTFKTADDQSVTVYFDITDFFGKMQ